MKCQCKFCKNFFSVANEYEGKNIRCPHCNNIITIREYIELTPFFTEQSIIKQTKKRISLKIILVTAAIVFTGIFLGFRHLQNIAKSPVLTAIAMNNLKKIGLAFYLYKNYMDWEGEFPAAQYNNSSGGLYLVSHIIDFNELCPEQVKKKKKGFQWAITRYAYIGSGFNEKDSANIPIAIEYPQLLNKYCDTINILFLDGRVLNFNFDKSHKSCTDIIKSYIQKNNISSKDTEKLLRNANLADEEFIYRQNHVSIKDKDSHIYYRQITQKEAEKLQIKFICGLNKNMYKYDLISFAGEAITPDTLICRADGSVVSLEQMKTKQRAQELKQKWQAFERKQVQELMKRGMTRERAYMELDNLRARKAAEGLQKAQEYLSTLTVPGERINDTSK